MYDIQNKRKFYLNMQAIDVCIIFSLAALIFSRFSGLGAIAYQNLYQAILYPARFEKDIFIQNTYYQGSSLFFNLVEWTGLSPDNDYIGFAVHVIFSVSALYFAFRIIWICLVFR